jgi:hypothetical protein
LSTSLDKITIPAKRIDAKPCDKSREVSEKHLSKVSKVTPYLKILVDPRRSRILIDSRKEKGNPNRS